MKKKDSLNIKTKRKAFRVAAAALALTTAITSWSLISNDKNKNNDHGHDHESTIENIHSEDNNVVDNEVEHNHEEEKEDIKEEDNIKGEEDEPVKEEPQKEYQDKVDNDKPEERPMYKDGKLIIPDLSNQEYRGDSISKALLLAGYNNSYEYRCLLAAHFGIENYRGTKEQNLLLLSYLRNLELFYKNHNEESNNNVNDNGNINNDNTNNGNNDNGNTNDNTNNDNNNNNNNNNTNEDDKKPGEDDQKPEEGKHKHKWSPWAYISDLLEGRKCQDNTCNEVETRGHKLAENKTTYKDLGNGTHQVLGYCTSCKHDVVKDAVPCNYTEWKVNPKNKAEETRTCLDCGHVETRTRVHECEEHVSKWSWLNKDKEAGKCDICGKEITRAHADKEEVVTCEFVDDSGHRRIVQVFCNECDPLHEHVISEVFKVLGHTQGIQIGKTVYKTNADGTHDETITYSCKDCYTNYTITLKGVSCNYTEWKVNPKNKAEEIRTCLDCGHKETRARVHECEEHVSKWSWLNKDKEAGKCDICGKEITRAHADKEEVVTYQYVDESGHKKTVEIYCNACDPLHEHLISTVVDTVEHNKGEQVGDAIVIDNNNGTHTIKTTYHCSDCNVNYTIIDENVPCKFTEWIVNPNNKAEEIRTCLDCGHKETRARVHECEEHVSKWSWLNKDKEAGKCDICGKEITRAHADKEEVVTYQYVDESGHKKTVEIYCNACDLLHEHPLSVVVDTIEHNKGEQVGDAIVIDNNNGTHTIKTTYHCSDCNMNYTVIDENVPCKFTEWIVNPNNKAEEIRTCLDCGHVETRARVHECSEHVTKWEWADKDQEKGVCDICGKDVYRNHPATDKVEVVTCTYLDDSGHVRTIKLYCNLCDPSHSKLISESIETIAHTQGAQIGETVITPNNNGTHKVAAKFMCDDCNHEYDHVNDNELCNYSSWIMVEGEKSHYKLCSDCGYTLSGTCVNTNGSCQDCGRDMSHTHSYIEAGVGTPTPEDGDDVCKVIIKKCQNDDCDTPEIREVIYHEWINREQYDDTMDQVTCSHCMTQIQIPWNSEDPKYPPMLDTTDLYVAYEEALNDYINNYELTVVAEDKKVLKLEK